jgi:hypothetical protein
MNFIETARDVIWTVAHPVRAVELDRQRYMHKEGYSSPFNSKMESMRLRDVDKLMRSGESSKVHTDFNRGI